MAVVTATVSGSLTRAVTVPEVAEVEGGSVMVVDNS